MSNPELKGARAGPPAMDELERAVEELLSRFGALTSRVRAAESRTAELEQLVHRFTGDPDDAERLLGRLQLLESENDDLRARLEEGRAGVERLLAKIRFLEDQR